MEHGGHQPQKTDPSPPTLQEDPPLRDNRSRLRAILRDRRGDGGRAALESVVEYREGSLIAGAGQERAG